VVGGEGLRKMAALMPKVFSDLGVLVVVTIWVILIFSVFMSGGCRNDGTEDEWTKSNAKVVSVPSF